MSNIRITFRQWIVAMEPDDDRFLEQCKDIGKDFHSHYNQVFQQLDCFLSEDIWRVTSSRNKMVQGFSGNPAHPFELCKVPIELWRGKFMYIHGADCHGILLLLGQEGARLPHHGNLAVEPRQHVASPKYIILHKNVTNWDIWNQSQRYFLLEVYHVYRDCAFDVSFVLHIWGGSDVSLNLF